MEVTIVVVLLMVAVVKDAATVETCKQCTTNYIGVGTTPAAGVPGTSTSTSTGKPSTTVPTVAQNGGNGRRRRDLTNECSKFTTYITCLDSSTAKSDGCPLQQADAIVIKNFDDKTVCKETSLSDACMCEKTFWGTTGDCTSLSALTTCLGNAKEKACDGNTDAQALLKMTQTRLACGAGSKGLNGLIATFLLCAIRMFST